MNGKLDVTHTEKYKKRIPRTVERENSNRNNQTPFHCTYFPYMSILRYRSVLILYINFSIFLLCTPVIISHMTLSKNQGDTRTQTNFPNIATAYELNHRISFCRFFFCRCFQFIPDFFFFFGNFLKFLYGTNNVDKNENSIIFSIALGISVFTTSIVSSPLISIQHTVVYPCSPSVYYVFTLHSNTPFPFYYDTYQSIYICTHISSPQNTCM